MCIRDRLDATLDYVQERERQGQSIGDVVWFGRVPQTKQTRHHRIDLLFSSASRTHERTLHARVSERMHGNARLRARQTEHPSRVAHQERGPRISVTAVEFFDHDGGRLDLRNDFRDVYKRQE